MCHVATGGQGAQVNGPWMHGSSWMPSEKVHVQGTVSWPSATYDTHVSAGTRTIASNDLPTDHTTGTFPIAASDPAAQYDRNGSTIQAEQYSFSLPATPSAASSPGCIYGEVGIMDDGVLLFDGFDALYRDALAHELQDSYDGHPNDMGYHDHGFISEIKNVAVSQVVGFAFDGYPITGPLLQSGKYLTTGDLDECHGMTSSVLLDGKLTSTYHYVLTQDFPYSVSCFHAKSYEPKPTPPTGPTGSTGSPQAGSPQAGAGQAGSGQAGMQQGGNPPAPPQAAIDACSGKSSGASCTVSGGPSGTCNTPPGQMSLACIPQ